MAKKEKTKSLNNSQHVFKSRFSWNLSCLLVNFYPSAPNVPFHIPPEKVKVHRFFFMFSGGEVKWENHALMAKTN